jgi:hypothetical protein
MPFESKAQARAAFGGYLGDEMKSKALTWAHETPNMKKLPEHAKKQVLKKAVSGKGGPFDVMAPGTSGAINAFNTNLANDKRTSGFNKPGSYLGTGLRGVIGGTMSAGAAKYGTMGRKQDVLKRAVKSIPQGSPINGIDNGPIKPATDWTAPIRRNKISI